MDTESIRQFAIIGVKVQLAHVLDELEELCTVFPRIDSLRAAVGAMNNALAEADVNKLAPIAKAPTRALVRVSQAPKPSRKKRGVLPKARPRGLQELPATFLEQGPLRSWLAGRDVLAVLAPAPSPLTVDEIATRLKVPYSTIWHRLQVRTRKGHVHLADASTRAFEITPGGRQALEQDRDSPDSAVS